MLFAVGPIAWQWWSGERPGRWSKRHWYVADNRIACGVSVPSVGQVVDYGDGIFSKDDCRRCRMTTSGAALRWRTTE